MAQITGVSEDIIRVKTVGGVLSFTSKRLDSVSHQELIEKWSLIDSSINVGVSNGISGEVQTGNGGINQFVSQLRDVVTSIGLSHDDERTVLVLGVLSNPFLQELMVTISGRLVSVLGQRTLVSRPVRETNKSGGLEVQNISETVPVALEVGQVGVFVGAEGSIFFKQTQQRGATRSSIHPQHQRFVFGVFFGFDQPVEEHLTVVKSDVTTVHIVVRLRVNARQIVNFVGSIRVSSCLLLGQSQGGNKKHRGYKEKGPHSSVLKQKERERGPFSL
mmetsp:Transcript_287/g.518  ORF Transcript_287/g.518 Transcript_287/m.518 type:complete len:275 (+) Transcript_287:674-1498(+)